MLNPAQLPDSYYEPSQRQYWFIPNGSGGHVSVNDAGVKRYLKSLGFSGKADDGQFLSPLEATVLVLQQQHELAYAGPLAGYHAGIHKIQGSNILVTTSPALIIPAAGGWPVLSKLLGNLLIDDGINQEAYFFGWHKVTAEALRNGRRRPSQALVLAGPAGCGKSLVQNLTTVLLGGRCAKPYQYMTGGTGFNRDLFTAEHLMVEDEVPSAEYRSRRNFGTHIKGVTVNVTQRMHQKFRDALTLEPFWRLTISVNDEPENLMVLPPIDDSIGDKIILLKCVKKPMPMPANTDEQKQRFFDTLVAELPAFLHWLDEWQIPEELRDERYGITSFHHPELLRAIDDLAPETRLLGLIDDELFALGPGSAGPWTGTARQLVKKLTSADFADSREARRLFSYNTACGTYLARLEQKYPPRVGSRTKRATATGRSTRRTTGQRRTNRRRKTRLPKTSPRPFHPGGLRERLAGVEGRRVWASVWKLLAAMSDSTHGTEQLPALVACLLASTREEEGLIDALCFTVLQGDWSNAAQHAEALASLRGLHALSHRVAAPDRQGNCVK